jgi:hypothetical protein
MSIIENYVESYEFAGETAQLQRHNTSRGLGDWISVIVQALGIKPCDSCKRRIIVLNKLGFGGKAGISGNCYSYRGKCTGFGRRQCVIAPSSYGDPSAPTIEQCCQGWFQYPWIEVCEGQAPTQGCGFCLW